LASLNDAAIVDTINLKKKKKSLQVKQLAGVGSTVCCSKPKTSLGQE
jgi:hypothetical protein